MSFEQTVKMLRRHKINSNCPFRSRFWPLFASRHSYAIPAFSRQYGTQPMIPQQRANWKTASGIRMIGTLAVETMPSDTQLWQVSQFPRARQ